MVIAQVYAIIRLPILEILIVSVWQQNLMIFNSKLTSILQMFSGDCHCVGIHLSLGDTALLHFIYWDSLPDMEDLTGLDSQWASTLMSQHMLAAADRYGLDRLRLLCEANLCVDVAINTVATTLALAEQHHCLQLKSICLEFIAMPENLRAVMQTDGFEYLKESCPSVLTELLEYVARINEHSVIVTKYGNEIFLDGTDVNGRRALLHFIYWDSLPDMEDLTGLDSQWASTLMSQHMLAAADRYGLDRLRLLCEANLCVDVAINTVATTLALAEQHHCLQLKSICLEFIAMPENLRAADRYGLDRLRLLCEANLCVDVAINTVATTLALAEQHHCLQLKSICLEFIAMPENLRAVMQTDGFEYLKESCPSVLTELLEYVARINEHSVIVTKYGNEIFLDGTDVNGRRLFFSYFKDLVGREVTVELKNDLAIRGTLHSVDQYLNIKLENTRVVDQDNYPHMVFLNVSLKFL
ncbi:unnamed protein product [Ilex paraguariensis]|uniref:Sm domain-containing protein n=1 Tax=Ilex paraguariensis TaxID=185542 RepID=A0ABC8S7L8_9AQUA